MPSCETSPCDDTNFNFKYNTIHFTLFYLQLNNKVDIEMEPKKYNKNKVNE